MNLFTKQKQTHRIENKIMVTKGKSWRRDKLEEYGINRYYYIQAR